MKKVYFKSVEIQNFLSVGDEPIVVEFERGINIITGQNRDKEDRRNGVGKSTIVDAIYFAIFGSTIRELKKEMIVNNINNSKCTVTLRFTVQTTNGSNDYEIVRTLSPSKCYLYINGADKTRDSIGNTNKLICEILSCSPSIFQNCIIMTINNTTPFMAQKSSEKRKFIEGIFSLEVFSDMLNHVKKEHTEDKKDLEVELTKFDEINNSLTTYKTQNESADADRKAKIKKYKTRFLENREEIKDLKSKLEEFGEIDNDAIKEKINKLSEAKTKCDTKRTSEFANSNTAKSNIKRIESDIAKIGTDEDICPTCQKPFDKEHDSCRVESKKKLLQEEINRHQEEKEVHAAKYEELTAKREKIALAIRKLEKQITNNKLQVQDKKNTEARIEQLKGWQASLREDLTSLKESATSFDTIIEDTQNRLTKVSGEIDRIRKIINLLDVAKFVLSEEGVKSYIVKQMLSLFNNRIAYYLKRMDANCICIFNEYFEEEIVNDRGKLCSYFNFSGAEKKNIDLACAFAFMSMRRMQGDVSYNLLMFDELIDSSLDEKGVELVLDIIKEDTEKNNYCTYIITHRKEAEGIGDNVIYLEKSNGITRRIS